jgi:hypothetical protein
MVPSTRSLSAVASAVLSGPPSKSLRCQSLALNDDLMFDQGDVPPRMKETLW